jgi:hypothetical protein
VTATSRSSPAVTATQVVNFTMPEVHGVTLTADPSVFATTPGGPATTTLTLRAVGNVTETVSFTATLPAGMTAGGLDPVTLTPGQTPTQTVTLTPATTAALNSRLAATITANYGSTAPVATFVLITVHVRSAQTVAIAQAAVAAGLADNATLADRPDAAGRCGFSTSDHARRRHLLARAVPARPDGHPARADPLSPFVAPLQPIRRLDAGDTAALLALLPASSTTHQHP